jgi:hypothetical protein
VAMLLEAIYEEDFYDFSHGFRRGRSPHRALKELRQQCVRMKIGWIVDADVSSFLDRSSQCPPADQTLSKSGGCWSNTLIRNPFRLPRRTCTAWSSPRFTRCHTV